MKKDLKSIVAQFFYGIVDEDNMFPYPTLSEEEKEFGKEMVDAIAKYIENGIDSAKMDEDGKIPEEVLKELADLGLYGLGVEEEYGGMNLSYSLYARVFSEISKNDASIATMLGAHQSIGYRSLINEGSEDQKKKWLPMLSSGEKIAAFCLTEPSSGSDAYSIKTKAIENEDGTFTLNGQKLWITNGGLADIYTVFAKTDHKDGDGNIKEKISCFLVEKGEGISFGNKEDKMGIRASETRAVFFDNVIVPKENIIGELGKGFKIAMKVLNSGRLSLGSGCVGGMKQLIKMSSQNAKSRKQFGKPIGDFGLIQSKITKMMARCYATESIVYMTTGLIDKGLEDYQLESAICKIYGSESLWFVVDQTLQIAAGNGYMKEYPYERLMRDSRINLIFEGTNEILRIFIALAGLKDLGEDLKDLGRVQDVSSILKDPVKSLGVLSDFLINRVNKMSGGKSLLKVSKELEKESDQFSNMLAKFSIQAENLLIKDGKKIIGNQYPQERIANMCIDLYVYSCILSRTTMLINDENISKEKQENIINLSKIALKDLRGDFTGNLKAMSDNNDKKIKSVSSYTLKEEGYDLDIL